MNTKKLSTILFGLALAFNGMGLVSAVAAEKPMFALFNVVMAAFNLYQLGKIQ